MTTTQSRDFRAQCVPLFGTFLPFQEPKPTFPCAAAKREVASHDREAGSRAHSAPQPHRSAAEAAVIEGSGGAEHGFPQVLRDGLEWTLGLADHRIFYSAFPEDASLQHLGLAPFTGGSRAPERGTESGPCRLGSSPALPLKDHYLGHCLAPGAGLLPLWHGVIIIPTSVGSAGK